MQNNLNRWYDAKVGRWMSQDPIGFEAGDDNLYRYVGNSSLLWVDPSGLVIKIIGSVDFQRKTERALNTLKEKPIGKRLVDRLDSSKNTHTIRETTGPNTTGPNGPYTVGKGMGSNIKFNPNRNQLRKDKNGKSMRTPCYVNLAHELGHAEGIDDGNQLPPDKNAPKKSGTTPPWEQNSMKTENQVRKEHGLGELPFYYP